MRTVIIGNPAAAAGKAEKQIMKAASLVKQSFRDCEVWKSSYAGEVRHLAHRAVSEQVHRVILLGGDGTLNEAINGFLEPSTGQLYKHLPQLMLFPIGTGGDFSRVIGTRNCSFEQTLRESTPRRIDVGQMVLDSEDGKRKIHYFLNIASVGVSAAIAHRVNRHSKRFGGNPAFVLGTLAGLANWKDQRVRLCIDDSLEREVSMSCIVVANGRYFGSGMRIAPNALLNDGVFDVVVLENMGAKTFVLNAHRLYRGSHLSLKGINVYRGRKIQIIPLFKNEPLVVETDGEYPGNGPLTCNLFEQAVEVLAPWHKVDTLID